MIGLLPGLRDTREAEAIAPWVTLRREAARHDLAPYAARVGELRLAPVGVREVEQRERRLDVPPAPACDEVEERVAARDEAPILDRGAVVEEAEAERGREAVAEVEREAAVHEERRRERDRVTVAEARVGVGEVVVGGEPACHPEEALDVDAVAPARAALVAREPVPGEEAAALDLAVEGDVDLIVARLDLEPALGREGAERPEAGVACTGAVEVALVVLLDAVARDVVEARSGTAAE